ncbi:hypothetical protein LSM04_003885 [Trypanosoma melophagium]|uniref:uncharacterized protein n=1 Tax=Trypanosoma melophagium TaxID=715481 RepID=UPI00351A4F02|nr:hypothetical protein LSM04_003885 [Trypanosoma melophagium]
MSDGETPRGPFYAAVMDHMKSSKVVIQELAAYLTHLREHYEYIQQKLRELTEELLQNGLHPNLASLREKSQQLMNNIHEMILTLFATVNAIDSAPDVAGKASSFLASFGLAVRSERANAGLCSRVPSYPMLKSRTPK